LERRTTVNRGAQRRIQWLTTLQTQKAASQPPEIVEWRPPDALKTSCPQVQLRTVDSVDRIGEIKQLIHEGDAHTRQSDENSNANQRDEQQILDKDRPA
jgi:hypothetical protein